MKKKERVKRNRKQTFNAWKNTTFLTAKVDVVPQKKHQTTRVIFGVELEQ